MTAATVPRGHDASTADDASRTANRASCNRKPSADSHRAAFAQLPRQQCQLARQLYPQLLERLDQELASTDPSKVTTQLILKAFENVPGASQQIQQILSGTADLSLLATSGLSTPPSLESVVSLHANPASTGKVVEGDYFLIQATSTMADCPAPQKPSAEPAPAPGSPPRIGSQAAQTQGDSLSGCSDLRGVEHSVLVAEVQTLQKHKAWADEKINQLIKRVRDAEGPQRLLKEEVQQLRLEKDSVEGKLKEFEYSLQKLKDCTYSESNRRQEYEMSLREAQAELRGASLREQEMQKQLRDAQTATKQERKKREAAERLVKKAGDERSESQAAMAEVTAAADRLSKDLEALQRAAHEQEAKREAMQDSLLAADRKAKIAEDKASALAAQLSNTRQEASQRASEMESLVAALTAQLDEAHAAAAERVQQSSFYSHFGGPSLFGLNFSPVALQSLAIPASPERFAMHFEAAHANAMRDNGASSVAESRTRSEMGRDARDLNSLQIS